MHPSQRLIISSTLPHALKAALAGASYKTFADLSNLEPEDLSIELSISSSQAQIICDCRDNPEPAVCETPTTSRTAPPPIIPASSSHRAFSTRFSTLSKHLDFMIQQLSDDPTIPGKGDATTGIQPGASVEISGPPGSGKTAIAIALALSSAGSPTAGEVLLIDTEGSVTPDRLKRTAESLTRNKMDSPETLTQRIHLLRIATQTQMIGELQIMDEWLGQHPQVNLVIIDTLSYHFRQPSMDMRTRTRMMELVKHQTAKATTMHGCAVVLTNQLATKLLTIENKPANFDTGDRAVLMPQLGDTWTTSTTIRVILFRGVDDLRYAHASSLGVRKDIPWGRYDVDHDGVPCDPITGSHRGPGRQLLSLKGHPAPHTRHSLDTVSI